MLIPPVHCFDHFDRHELVVGAGEVPVVPQQDRDVFGQTEAGHQVDGVAVLLFANCGGGDLRTELLGGVDGQATPAGSDLDQMVSRLEVY